MCWSHCSESSGEVGTARHCANKSSKLLSSVAGDENILSGLGELLTSSPDSLSELMKMIPSVTQLSHGVTTSMTSDGRAVKRRRVSQRNTLLPASPAVTNTTDHHRISGLYACHHRLLWVFCDHFVRNNQIAAYIQKVMHVTEY